MTDADQLFSPAGLAALSLLCRWDHSSGWQIRHTIQCTRMEGHDLRFNPFRQLCPKASVQGFESMFRLRHARDKHHVWSNALSGDSQPLDLVIIEPNRRR